MAFQLLNPCLSFRIAHDLYEEFFVILSLRTFSVEDDSDVHNQKVQGR